jgi:hypothetical protein
MSCGHLLKQTTGILLAMFGFGLFALQIHFPQFTRGNNKWSDSNSPFAGILSHSYMSMLCISKELSGGKETALVSTGTSGSA